MEEDLEKYLQRVARTILKWQKKYGGTWATKSPKAQAALEHRAGDQPLDPTEEEWNPWDAFQTEDSHPTEVAEQSSEAVKSPIIGRTD